MLDGAVRKICIRFPNGDHDDIDSGIVSEGMSLSRILNESEELNFGEVNASKFSCEVMDVDDITGLDIQVYANVDGYGSEVKLFMGTVSSAKKRPEHESRTIVAYDSLYYHLSDNVSEWYESYFSKSVKSDYKGTWSSSVAYTNGNVVLYNSIYYQYSCKSTDTFMIDETQYKAVSYCTGKDPETLLYDAYGSRYISQLSVYEPYNYGNSTLKDFRDSLFLQIGIDQNEQTLMNDDLSITKTITSNELTFRDCITAICQINACFGGIDEEGNFKYITLGSDSIDYTGNYQATGSSYEEYTSCIDQVRIYGITGDLIASGGAGSNIWNIYNNYLVYSLSDTQAASLAQSLYEAVSGYVYTPAEIVSLISLYADLGTEINVTTYKGDTFKTYVFRNELSGSQLTSEKLTATGSKERSELTSTADSLGRLEAKTDAITEQIYDRIEADYARVKSIEADLGNFDSLVATKATIESLEAAQADIDNLEADTATINKTLTANGITADTAVVKDLSAAQADIDALETDTATINKKLTAAEADIDTLEADNVTITGILDANKITAKTAVVDDIKSNSAEIETIKSDYVKTSTLEADYIDADTIKTRYALIDGTNINEAFIGNAWVQSGILNNAVVASLDSTGIVTAVYINADTITAGTLKAERILLVGEGGLIYELNTTGTVTEADQTAYNSLDGKIITAASITASKISVDDLTAFNATIAGIVLDGTNYTMHTVGKTSVDATTAGFYFDKSGQFAVGNDSNYLKFYKEGDEWKLAISAATITISSGKTVEEAIEDLENSIAEVEAYSIVVSYQLSDQGSSVPTGTWVSDMPTQTDDQPYLWTRTIYSYSSGKTTTAYDVSSKGKDGQDGADGKDGEDGKDGVTLDGTPDVSYQVGTSGAVVPTGTWSSTPVATTTAGQWLWTRTITNYSDGTSVVAYSNAAHGATGEKGTSVTILGSYNTLSNLTEEHPTGDAGDAYIVGTDLYVWSETESAWVDVGQIQGDSGISLTISHDDDGVSDQINYEAHVVLGTDSDITSKYDPSWFSWYLKTEDGITDLSSGTTSVTVSRSTAGYGAMVGCVFTNYVNDLLFDSDSAALYESEGARLVAGDRALFSSTTEVGLYSKEAIAKTVSEINTAVEKAQNTAVIAQSTANSGIVDRAWYYILAASTPDTPTDTTYEEAGWVEEQPVWSSDTSGQYMYGSCRTVYGDGTIKWTTPQQASSHASTTIAKNAIISEVESTLGNYATSSELSQTSEEIKLSVSETYLAQADAKNTYLSQTDAETTYTAQGSVRDSFASESSSITVNSGTITFETGTLVVDSDNFKVAEDGTIEANNATITGKVTTPAYCESEGFYRKATMDDFGFSIYVGKTEDTIKTLQAQLYDNYNYGGVLSLRSYSTKQYISLSSSGFGIFDSTRENIIAAMLSVSEGDDLEFRLSGSTTTQVKGSVTASGFTTTVTGSDMTITAPSIYLNTSSGYKLAMQADGNLVIYNPSGTAVWNSGTAGK